MFEGFREHVNAEKSSGIIIPFKGFREYISTEKSGGIIAKHTTYRKDNI